MRDILVDTVEGVRLETVYGIDELSYLGKQIECDVSHKWEFMPGEEKRRRITYLEIPCAFDIETTNIYEKDERGNITGKRPYSYMYHWQFCLDDQVCFGRTWKDFRKLMYNLRRRMGLSADGVRLVVYVHNLSFEFQHFRRFVNVIDSFCKEPYKPLKILLDNGVEFRDSYALSNMTLAKFCENEQGVIHYKLSGEDYDYSKIRTAETKLTEKEDAYCYNDVRGLSECIASRMEEDTLASIPMTSTGYVRRECRNSMRKNKKNRIRFKENRLSPDLYKMCREAFRGGDTHANIRHANQTIRNRGGSRALYSYDISSSYPWQMLSKRFPSSPFTKITLETFEKRDLRDFALLFRVRLMGAEYAGSCGIPYIPRSKCTAVSSDAVIDNGRILRGDIEITVTDIDWKIIKAEYKYEKVYFKDIYASRYELMPAELRGVIMKYYKAKTELKGIKSKEYEYMKSKNKLNAIYGMGIMRIDQVTTVYEDGEYKELDADLSDLLERYYKSRNSFLSYQQGVWVTAWARYQLRQMLWRIGKDVIYCDTDSIKYIGDHKKDFEAMNLFIQDEAERIGAYAYDRKGMKQYLGLWDYEGQYEEFKTIGAKKYIYKKKKKYYSTIAGVNRKAGAAYFNKNGIDSFKIGNVIKDSGHLTAFYNDDDIHYIEIDGCRMETASNVALVDNTYTIGVTEGYLDLLEKALDMESDIVYI